jgi:ketosteroid isomerase-like protein
VSIDNRKHTKEETPMTAQTNVERSRLVHEAVGQNRLDDVLALADDEIDVIAYTVGQTFHGKQQFRDFMMVFKTALPDLAIQHTNTIAMGDQVAIEFIATGTHTAR